MFDGHGRTKFFRSSTRQFSPSRVDSNFRSRFQILLSISAIRFRFHTLLSLSLFDFGLPIPTLHFTFDFGLVLPIPIPTSW
jgi:hypothetical protein